MQETPDAIFFFVNGMTACFNADGEQIPKYQGRHREALDALKKDGHDWTKFREILGVPSFSSEAEPLTKKKVC